MKPRQEGRRKRQKIRKAQISSGKSEIFSDLIPTFFRFFRLFSAGIVGVGVFNFISFNADFLTIHQIFLILRLWARLRVCPGHIPTNNMCHNSSRICLPVSRPNRDIQRARSDNFHNLLIWGQCTLTGHHSSYQLLEILLSRVSRVRFPGGSPKSFD